MFRIIVFLCFLGSWCCGYAAGNDDLPSKRYLKFFNDSGDAINLTLEESCLPSYDASDSYNMDAFSEKVIEYDMTVASCIMIVPVKLGLGARTSLFILESLDRRHDLDPSLSSTCLITVKKMDDLHSVYDLETDCMRVISKRY